MDIFTKIILGLLSIDTIRALIAMLGWIKPDSKFAWLFYGRYERNLIISALKELGYGQEKSEQILRNMRKLSKTLSMEVGVHEDDADVQLVLLLADYIEMFPSEIHYGESGNVSSHYYIDTMEISHNKEDLKKMYSIMMYLIHRKSKKIPKVIITPKGGNPLFAQTVAAEFKSKLLIAKSEADNARVGGVALDTLSLFKINYEGSRNVLSAKKDMDCCVLDCNTSNGNQLQYIIREINQLINRSGKKIKLKNPQQVFILFCVDKYSDDIDRKFKELNVVVNRFFDLDDETKNMLYELKSQCDNENRKPNYFNDLDKHAAEQILKKLKEKGNYYY